MLTRIHFPLLMLTALGAALAAAPATARAAEENVLRGPHPFLKDNEVSLHLMLAGGLGDSWGGTKVAADYGYHLTGPSWLNLQINFQKGTCPLVSSGCLGNGTVFETLVGGKWKFPTQLPLVPYAKGAAGLIYLFPDQARSAVGLALRVGGGVNYFFFDWLGLGLELGMSLGHGFFDASYTAGHGYAILDLGGGVEFQF